jgi:peptide/nickel transport system substrate-binding protein
MRLTKVVGVLAATALVALVAAAPGGAAETEPGSGSSAVLKVGWAHDPATLNPFVGLDEENYDIWTMNWDLLVGFSTKNMSPVPGIAKSWEISKDKKTVTFHLDPKKKWSDGVPVTSADVKYSLEALGGHGALFTSYTENITAIETPDPHTVVIKTSKPDTRIVGGLFIYILPKHIWGKHSISELTGSFQAELPMVGSGPFTVTKFEKGRILILERNPEFSGPTPKYEKIEFIKYGNEDAVERALQVGEVDLDLKVSSGNFARLGEESDIETVKASSSSYTEMAFNVCPEEICPDAQRNPAITERAVRQAVGYAVDRNRINQIAARDTSFVAYGILPSYYKSFYEKPELDYEYDPEKAEQILEEAGWEDQGGGARKKGGEELKFNLYVRSESSYDIQAAKLIAEEAKQVGIEFNVQVVSTEKLTEITTAESNGKPAPEYDTFIWGWGGDPYDPSFLLSILTTEEIGGGSDSYFSNAEYDRLYKEQSGEFDVARRKELIHKMVAITQEELPYLVLSYDPILQAYRSDLMTNVKRVCPEDQEGDAICAAVSYAPLETIEPGGGSSGGGGGSAVVIAIVAVVVVAGVGFFVIRSRRRRESEPLELED